MTPWAEELFKPIKSSYAGPDGYLNRTGFQVLSAGRAADPQGVMQMVRLPDEIIQLFEFDHWVRHISTDGRKHDTDAAFDEYRKQSTGHASK